MLLDHAGQADMRSSTRFRINDKQVVHELVEGEVLAINLDTGTYYSMPGVGSQIWLSLADGASTETMTQALVDAYAGEPAIIEDAVTQFFAKLNEERLIVADESSSDAAAPRQMSIGAEQKKAFVAPVIEIYTDMQDLLLLDPIHDVDEAGWPVLKPEAAPAAKK